jgi:hypothetical protein
MSSREKPPEKPAVDLSTIRYLLALTPEERLRLAVAEAHNLRRFDLEVEKSKRRS